MVKFQCCNKEKEFSSWSSLPTDLLWLIIELLDFIDIYSVSAVCRNWRSAWKSYNNPNGLLKPKDRFPWLMIITNVESSVRKFFQPSTNITRSIDLQDFQGTNCIHSKDGWLLLTRRTFDCDANRLNLFLFNPFTMAKIQLPKLEKEFVLFRASFSTNLGHPKFVILVGGVDSKMGMVSTWNLGDNTWSNSTYPFQVNIPRGHRPYLCNIWLHDDQSYYFNSAGSISVLNYSTGKWLSRWSNKKIDSSYEMAVCGGDLFVIPLEDSIKFLAYKFDPFKNEWVTVQTENLFWFVGCNGRIGCMVREHWSKVFSMVGGLASHGCRVKLNGGSVIVDAMMSVRDSTISVWINVG